MSSAADRKSFSLGVDVGGTFTDVLIVDDESGELTVEKVLSTPDDQSVGVLNGVERACERLSIQASDLDVILHGSTVVTNLILEQKGATGGLLTSPGSEHILHLARAWTPGPLYGWMAMDKPDPIVDLWRTRSVAARMAATGDIVHGLDQEEVRTALAELVDEGIESLTIAFLNSYVDPKLERQAREIAVEAYPQLPVSISSDLVSEYREYERTLTAVLNAYVAPQVAKYVDHLESLLADGGFSGRLNVIRSDGGTMSTRSTKERPIDIALSGPSGGAVGSAYIANEMGVPDMLTLDMGGTSTDVSLCSGGSTPIKRDAELGYFQFQSRSVDIHSVGAGGGSIAYLTPVGALRVGPSSAGADPGPAAYGAGGVEPTVTDANIVLHRIPPGAKLAGTLNVHEDAALRAVGTIAEGLGIEITAAAEAIITIANENMHAALRVVSVERGYDPREFGLVAFGGAGPLHGNALGRLIHASPVVIPATPGVLSAFGFLAANVQNEFARTYLRTTEETPVSGLREDVNALRTEAAEWLKGEDVEEADQFFAFFADCRYYMQDIQIPCEIEEAENLEHGYERGLRSTFEREHERRFGFTLGAPIEIATLRCVGRSASRRSALAEAAGATGAGNGNDSESSIDSGPDSSAHDRTEQVYFNGEWHDTRVFDRTRLVVNSTISGPAIIVQQDSTAVIEPGYRADVDDYRNLVIRALCTS